MAPNDPKTPDQIIFVIKEHLPFRTILIVK